MGKAQVANRCDLCLAATHTTRECSLASDGDPDLPTQMRAVELAVVMFANRGGAQTVDRQQSSSQCRLQDDICRVWNEKRCYFKCCRFRHACAACARNHPMVAAQTRGQGRPSVTAITTTQTSRAAYTARLGARRAGMTAVELTVLCQA